MGTNKDMQLMAPDEQDTALRNSFRQTLEAMKAKQCERQERIKDWIAEFSVKYNLPQDFETNITALINQIGRDVDKSPIAIVGWDLVDKWRTSDLPEIKKSQKKLADIKSLLNQDADIEITTHNGDIIEVWVRKKGESSGSRSIKSHVIIGWFVAYLKESNHRNRFFDDSIGECSRMIFSSGEIYNFLRAILKSTVDDFGAGNRENTAAVKSKVYSLKPLYRYLKSFGIYDADNQIIALLGLENILRSNDFVTYIEKRAK